MTKKLFVDTAMLKLSTAKRSVNELAISNINLQKVETMTLMYLKIANYLLAYTRLQLLVDFFNDKQILIASGESMVSSNIFALIDSKTKMKTLTFDFYNRNDHMVNAYKKYENARFEYPDRFSPHPVHVYTATDEILVHTLTMETPMIYADKLRLGVDYDDSAAFLLPENLIYPSTGILNFSDFDVFNTQLTIKEQIQQIITDQLNDKLSRNFFIPNVSYCIKVRSEEIIEIINDEIEEDLLEALQLERNADEYTFTILPDILKRNYTIKFRYIERSGSIDDYDAELTSYNENLDNFIAEGHSDSKKEILELIFPGPQYSSLTPYELWVLEKEWVESSEYDSEDTPLIFWEQNKFVILSKVAQSDYEEWSDDDGFRSYGYYAALKIYLEDSLIDVYGDRLNEKFKEDDFYKEETGVNKPQTEDFYTDKVVEQVYDILGDSRLEANVQINDTELPIFINMNKKINTFNVLPRYLSNTSYDNLIRFRKGTSVSLSVKYTQNVYVQGTRQNRGLPLSTVGPNIISVLVDKVEFISLNLQDLLYNKPVESVSKNIDDIIFRFFNSKGERFPILKNDDIIIGLQFEAS